jgi:hypothetical protein
MSFVSQWLKKAGKKTASAIILTAISIGTIDIFIRQFDWKMIAIVSLLAGLYSIISSLIFGLALDGPLSDGRLLIDTSDENRDIYRLEFVTPLDKVAKKGSVRLLVDPNAKLGD